MKINLSFPTNFFAVDIYTYYIEVYVRIYIDKSSCPYEVDLISILAIGDSQKRQCVAIMELPTRIVASQTYASGVELTTPAEFPGNALYTGLNGRIENAFTVGRFW